MPEPPSGVLHVASTLNRLSRRHRSVPLGLQGSGLGAGGVVTPASFVVAESPWAFLALTRKTYDVSGARGATVAEVTLVPTEDTSWKMEAPARRSMRKEVSSVESSTQRRRTFVGELSSAVRL